MPRHRWVRRGVQCVVAVVVVLVGVGLAFPYPEGRLGYGERASTRLLDRRGRLVHELTGARGDLMQPVELDDVAPAVVLATLSSEDATFYYHPGVDPMAVGRAVWLNVRAGRVAYGGSTITQQLAKQLDPQPRTIGGKLREGWDAWRLELQLTKSEILTQYLNRVPYGRLAVGIEAAASRYFGKRASDLTLDEAALLAVLPRAPSYYNPDRHPERAIRRRAHVLRRMADRGWISREEAERAAGAPIELVPLTNERRAPHLVDLLTVRELVRSGATQTLTIDLELQEALEQRVRLHLSQLESQGATQAGVVVLDNATGDVLAMVGSRRYGEVKVAGAVNATTSLRAPGSTLKPFVYALAMEDGAHGSTLVLDVPTHFKGYQPRNTRFDFHGAVPLREALGSSLNVPAVRTAAQVGPDRVAQLLHDVGLHSVNPQAPHGLAIALGGVSVPLIELANGYATLARGGWAMPYRLLLDEPLPAGRQVLSPEIAFQVTHALADPTARRREFGLETPLDLPFPAAAKTGTSQAFCDNVVVGFTPRITVAAWVGNFDGAPLRGLLAMEGAAPLWREAMLRAAATHPSSRFERPPGIAEVKMCIDSGLPVAWGTASGESCVRHRTEFVSKERLERGELLGAMTSPAVRDAHQLGEGTPDVRIVAPPADATFLIDPLLPLERQRIALRAKLPGEGERRVRWFVNGRAVAESDTTRTAYWTLRPGRIRLRAEVIGENDRFDEIEFEVEGT